VLDCCGKNTTPSQIITKSSIEKCDRSVAGTGGSTNAVLHLLAIAREAGCPFRLTILTAQLAEPILADLKTWRTFCRNRPLLKAGGTALNRKAHA